jgi:hypothetical protein
VTVHTLREQLRDLPDDCDHHEVIVFDSRTGYYFDCEGVRMPEAEDDPKRVDPERSVILAIS